MSSSSTVSTPIDVPPPPPTIRNPFTLHIKDLVHVELDNTNYLSWAHLFEPILRLYRLTNHIDGTAPPEFLETSSADASADDVTNRSIPNPAHSHWMDLDALILSWINATVTSDVLPLLYHATTARQAWQILSSHFLNRSAASESVFRNDLRVNSKGDKTADEYMRKIKTLSDSLTAIGQPLTPSELRGYVFQGLPPEYLTFVSIASSQTPKPTFQELWNLLLVHEQLLAQMNARPASLPTPPPATALTAVSGTPAYRSSGSRGRFGGRHRGRGSFRGRSGHSPGRWSGFSSGHREWSSSSSSPHSSHNRGLLGPTPSFVSMPPSSARISCQVCGRPGHSALECNNRFNQDYQPTTN